MKTPGIIRKVDELGRIVIPSELRKTLKINSGDSLELHCEGEILTLQKFSPSCVFCNCSGSLLTYKEKYICGQCLQELKRG